MSINFKHFVEKFNLCFIDKDVEAYITPTNGLLIRIEERDISFDADLTFNGQGTNLTYFKKGHED